MPFIPVTSSFIPVEEDASAKRSRLIIEQDQLEAQPEPSTLGQLPSILGQSARTGAGAAIETLAGVPETVGRLGQKFERMAGQSGAEFNTLKLAEGLRSLAKEIRGETPDIEGSFFLEDVPSAVGSTLPFLGAGKIAQLLGQGAVAAPATLGAMAAGAQGYQRAEAAGADEDTAFLSLLANAGVGTTEALPLARILGRANRASSGVLLQALEGGSEEALQEVFQGTSANAIANALTDEDVSLLDGTLREGSAGGVAGGLFGLLAGVAGRRRSPGRMAGQMLEDNVSSAEGDVEGQALDALSPQNAQRKVVDNEPRSRPGILVNPADLRTTEEGAVSGGRSTEAGTTTGETVAEERLGFTTDSSTFLRSGKKFRTGAEIEGKQLGNALKNAVTPGEWMALEEAGIGEVLKGKVKPEDVAKWVDERGPKVEVKELYAGDENISDEEKEFGRLQHWYDTLTDMEKAAIDVSLDPVFGDEGEGLAQQGWPEKEVENAIRYNELAQKDFKNKSNDSATRRFEQVNPKPLGKMPGAVDLLVKIPMRKGFESTLIESRDAVEAGLKYHSSHYPQEGKNLLAHIRGHIEERDGMKVFSVNELQSDWGQRYQQEAKQWGVAKKGDGYVAYHLDGDTREMLHTIPKTKEEAEKIVQDNINDIVKNDPLLKHYERLAVKAAIDHARKIGADAVSFPDAETAMLTEMHDQATNLGDVELVRDENGNYVKKVTITQEPGMRMHYDPSAMVLNANGDVIQRFDSKEDAQRWVNRQPRNAKDGPYKVARGSIHDIAEELTGMKGEAVEFGEHKNVRTEGNAAADYEDGASLEEQLADGLITQQEYDRLVHVRSGLRPNLIFRNPDGTSKTTITGRLYPIRHAKRGWSLFGSDKAQPTEAPAEFKAVQPGIPGKIPDVEMWNLKESIPGTQFKAGSTVSRQTLEALGYKLPKKGMQVKVGKKQSQGGFLRIPGPLRQKHTAPLPPSAVPDFMPKTQANEEFSKLVMAEKIPILRDVLGGRGSWLNNRPRILLPQDKAIAAWYAERHGVGRAYASALAERIRGEVNDAFKADKNGDLNVKGRTSAASLKISDVFEELQRDPNAYQLTPEQQRVWKNILSPVLGQMHKLNKKYKLVDPLDAYFMRGHAKPPKGKKLPPGGGAKPGSKQGFQRERVFDTEAEGWSLGYKFNSNVEERLIQGVENMYRAIADVRLAQDPVIQGRTIAQVRNDLRAAYPNLSADKIRRMADSVAAKGRVNSLLFRKIYPADLAERINAEFASEQSRIQKNVSTVNSFLKAIKLGFDFGVGQIQLLPTLYNRPDVWLKAQSMAMYSFMTEDGFSSYARNNTDAIQELAKYGSSVGRLEEYMRGVGSSLPKALEWTVVGKPVAAVTRAFGRHFQTALDVAKVEMWKAWRDVTPADQRAEVVQTIEAVLLTGRMESSMVSHRRSLLERVVLLAPTYYRGAINFATAWAQSGVSGKIGRRAMSRFVTGSLAMYVGVALKIGMDWDEITERLDPRKPEFLMWTIEDEDGRPLNVGIGGIMKSFLRLGGEMVKFAQRVKKGDVSWADVNQNPLSRWLRGHSSPSVGVVWNLISGEDFRGRDSDLMTNAKGMVPLALEGGSSRSEKLLQTVGIGAWPGRGPSPSDIAKRLFGTTDVETLPIGKRRKVAEVVAEEAPEADARDKKRIATRALEHMLKRQDRVNEGVSKANQGFLEEHGLTLPGYQTSETVAGVRIPMTEKERDFYHGVVVKQYDWAVDRLRSQNDWGRISDRAKQARFERLVEAAKKRARAELLRARRSGSIIEQD